MADPFNPHPAPHECHFDEVPRPLGTIRAFSACPECGLFPTDALARLKSFEVENGELMNYVADMPEGEDTRALADILVNGNDERKAMPGPVPSMLSTPPHGKATS
jgi:hypothetical protein